MIIKRNQLLLSVKVLLLLTGMTLFSDAVDAKSLDEQPPPWQARPNLANNAKAIAPPQATSNVDAGSSIESWYRNRQTQASKATDSLESLKTRAEQGDQEAAYALGMRYQTKAHQDPAQAQQWLTKAANANHSRAQYALALLLRGQNADAAQSVQWQEKAAKAGLPEAQYGLGVLYANGEYVQADANKANYWFTQAANGGNEMAKLALGQLANAPAEPAPVAQAANPEPEISAAVATESAAGFTETQSEATAADKFDFNAGAEPVAQANPAPQVQPAPAAKAPAAPAPQVAAAPVEAEAEVAAQSPEDWVDEVATQPQVEQNTSAVDIGSQTPEQIEASAQRGDRYAQLMLGALYEDGSKDGKPDMKQAAIWYEKAAKQNYPKAQHNLALLYEDGRGVPQDYKKAVYWYQKAAKAGFSEAQNNLAVLYIMGNGVTKDRAMAEKLLRSAVAQDNENAKRNLSMLLQQAPS